MKMRQTVRSDKRPLAQERTTAVRRRRQEEINAADRVMTTTEAHPDQLAALQKSCSKTLTGAQFGSAVKHWKTVANALQIKYVQVSGHY